jgi:hypothetical protein
MKTLKGTAYEAACYDAALQFRRAVVARKNDWETELQLAAVERNIEPHHIIEALCRVAVAFDIADAVSQIDALRVSRETNSFTLRARNEIPTNYQHSQPYRHTARGVTSRAVGSNNRPSD